MEIVVTGRNTEVPERFRAHAVEKVSKVETLNRRIQRIEIELTKEHNPRQSDQAERVELTVRGKGPLIRAEAAASDRYAALDLATAKLVERVRRHRDRFKDHKRKGQGHPLPHELLTPLDEASEEAQLHDPYDEGLPPDHLQTPQEQGEITEGQLGDSPVVVRQKLNSAVPMTVDQALYQMELLGHTFFQFVDDATGQPCVVYKRKGWTYGVLRLDITVDGWGGPTDGQAAIDANAT